MIPKQVRAFPESLLYFIYNTIVSLLENTSLCLSSFSHQSCVQTIAQHRHRRSCRFSHIVFIGARVAGHRGYFLKGVGLLLNQALINHAIAMLTKKDFTCMQTPFFMDKHVMAKTAQLSDFDEQLYRVVCTCVGACVRVCVLCVRAYK